MYFCEVWITLLILTCWIFSLLASFRASITQIYLTALQKQTWLISWESKTWWFFFKGLSSLFYPSQPNGGLFGTGHPLMIITFIIYEQSLFFSELKMFLLRRFPPLSFGPICTAWDLRLDFRCAFYSLLFFFFHLKRFPLLKTFNNCSDHLQEALSQTAALQKRGKIEVTTYNNEVKCSFKCLWIATDWKGAKHFANIYKKTGPCSNQLIN